VTLLGALAEYRDARRRLITLLNISMSNRDPLGEFAEQFVAAISGGKLATSRLQRGWDVVLLDGKEVQVKSLSEPERRRVAERTHRPRDPRGRLVCAGPHRRLPRHRGRNAAF